jgi:hypothetical protein
MMLSRRQNVGRNRDTKIANRSFENVSQIKYLGTTATNLNLIQKEIKRRLNSDNTYLLPFDPELSVFSSAVENYKDQNIQDYNFACGSVWV